MAQSGVDRWHYGRNDDAVDPLHFNLVQGKKVAEEHAIFIHGLGRDRRHAPVGYHQLVIPRLPGAITRSFGEHPQHRIRVADIENKKHD